MPRVLSVDPLSPDASCIAEAVDILRRGGLVAIPTETVYGLAGRALDPDALRRIFAAKGRPTSHPLIAHVLDAQRARALASSWSDDAARLAARFFPGPLTLVVPRADSVPLELTAGGPTVAVRAPTHAVARALLAALGEPLAAPSANRYQSVSPTRAEHVVQSLGDRVDLVLDAGPTTHGIESTVIDVSSSPPRVLRPGAMAIADLRSVAPDLVVIEDAIADDAAVRASPGQGARHYAPRATVEVVEGQAAALSRAHSLSQTVSSVALVLRSPVEVEAAATPVLSVSVLGSTAESFGAMLFEALHAADAAGAAVVVVQAPPAGEAWLAIRDRLRRAQA